MKNNQLKTEESHLHPVFHRIPVEVYEPLSIWLSFCASDQDTNDTFTDLDGDKIPPMQDKQRAITTTVETKQGGWQGVLIRFDNLDSMNDHATVTHESVHAAMFFFNLIGSQLIDTADHEPFAYLAGFTARKIHETYLMMSDIKKQGESFKQQQKLNIEQ